MTPHYVAIREEWTVQQVLDYVRQHGQDSDTLNVLYVIKDDAVLVDGIRVREFLLAPPTRRVAEMISSSNTSVRKSEATSNKPDGSVLMHRKEIHS